MSDQYEDASEHDHEISAIYRKARDPAPPTSLDDTILATAKRAAWRRKQRWMLPLSTAAVLVVSVTLLLDMREEWDFSREVTDQSTPSQSLPPAPLQEPARMEKKREASRPAAPQEYSVEEESYRMTPAEVTSDEPSQTAPSPIEEKAANKPSSAGLASDVDRLRKGTPAPSGERTEQEARERAMQSGVLAFSDEYSYQNDSADEQASAKSREALGASPEPRIAIEEPIGSQDIEQPGQVPLEPKPWIARIRKLVKAGEMEAAQKELESFKKRYPNYTLPEDLKSFDNQWKNDSLLHTPDNGSKEQHLEQEGETK